MDWFYTLPIVSRVILPVIDLINANSFEYEKVGLDKLIVNQKPQQF